MPIYNGKKVTPFLGLKVKSVSALKDAVIQFDNVNTAPTTSTGYYYLYVSGGVLKYDNGSSVVSLTGGGSGTTPSWETIYNDDKTLTINSTTLTFALTHATNNGLTITGSAGSAGQCLQITNSGSGDDIQGTSDTWAVTKAGLATFTGIDGCDSLTAAANLVLEATGAGTISIGATSTGAIDIGTGGGAVTVATAMTASLGITVTAGGILSSDGIVDIVDNSNAASSLRVTNDTQSTYGNASDAGMVVFRSESLTTGALLHLSLDETPLAGGFFLRCWSQDAGAAAFTIGELGATVIAGSATGTDALTLTAGDITITDGVLNLTQSADASAMVIVADAVTTGNVIDVNADAVTSGTVLHLDTTAATFTGLYLDCYDGAASDFKIGLYGATTIAGNGGSTVLTVTAGDLVVSDGSLSLTDADEATSLTIINDTAASVNVIDINADGITDGTVLHIDSTVAGMTTGLFIDCYDGAASAFKVGKYGATTIAGVAGSNVFTVTAGDLVVSDGSLTLTDGDEASSLTIVNDTAASVNVIDINADGITDGTILHIDSSVAGMTTGLFIDCYDGVASAFKVAKYGAVTIAGNAATDVFTITAGHAVLTSGNLTLTSGNAVLTSGNLTMTAGSATFTDGNITLSEGKLAITDTADERVLAVTGNVTAASQEPVLFDQTHLTAAVCVMKLNQDDTDEGFINFVGTAGAGNSLDTNTTSGATTHHIKIEINGTAAWIAASTTTPS